MPLKVITHPVKEERTAVSWEFTYTFRVREQKTITPWHFQYLSPPAPPCSPKETFETLTKIITCETMVPTGVLFRKFAKSRQHMEKICKATLSCNNNSIRILTSVKCDFFRDPMAYWDLIFFVLFSFFLQVQSNFQSIAFIIVTSEPVSLKSWLTVSELREKLFCRVRSSLVASATLRSL